jgi:hypothetical protein
VLQGAGAHVGSLDLLAPMIVGGVAMGMVFVPLFDIVLAGVEPYQIGSASGVLQAINSLATSLGVAGIGAIFFGFVGAGGAHRFIVAAQWTALVAVGLLAVAFVLGFRLPGRARELAPKAPEAPAEAAVQEPAELLLAAWQSPAQPRPDRNARATPATSIPVRGAVWHPSGHPIP